MRIADDGSRWRGSVKTMAFMPLCRMGPPPRSFRCRCARLHHGPGSLRPTEYKVAARMFVRDKRAPPRPVHPDHNERAAVLGFVKVWPGIAESMRRYLSDGHP